MAGKIMANNGQKSKVQPLRTGYIKGNWAEIHCILFYI